MKEDKGTDMEREIVKVLEIIAVAAVLCVLEMIREIHTFKVTHYTVTAPKACGGRDKVCPAKVIFTIKYMEN